MTPRQKAKELVCDFYAIQSNEYNYGIDWKMAKQCALIAVDEMIHYLEIILGVDKQDFEYWQEVKEEIENL